MQEKIQNIINNININNICPFKNLIDAKALSKIIIKNNTINFAIDIGILKINNHTAQILTKKITNELNKITNHSINIILTQNQSTSQPPSPDNNTQNIVKGVKNIIVIASGKGGVGKSTVSVNLAISLKRLGYKIGLVDADIYGPSITHLMNLKGKPKTKNNLMIPIHSYGIDCISVGSLVEANKAAVWRGPMITKVLTQLISGSKWNDIDYLIIDLPPGTGDVHLSLIQQFKPNGAILVSTPQKLSTIDVVKAIDMFQTLKTPILGIIQNMSYLLDKKGNKNYLFGKDNVKKMTKNLKLNFLGDIPISPTINQNNDDQNPICNQNPSHNISLTFGIITENLLEKLNPNPSLKT